MPDLFLAEKKQTSLPDASERELALDIRASWIVEAPAGSGKTGLLIQRYLKLLADDSVESPEQILAITFTRKATAEMRERVLAQLQAAANHEEPANAFDRETRPFAQAALDRDHALNWQLLDQPARLNIRTIDSVCSDIASSLPLLSGSGGRRSTVEDAFPLYLTAARRTFMQLGDPRHPELDRALQLVLLHRDGNLPECERLLAEMLEHREQWGEFVPIGSQPLDDAWLDSTILPRLERALEQAICAALTQLARTTPANILSQLTIAAAEMAHLEPHDEVAVSPIAVCAGRHRSPKETSADLAHWRALVHLLVTKENEWRKVFYPHIVKFQLSKPDEAHLKSIVDQLRDRDDLLHHISNLGALPPAKYPLEQWVVAKALFRILNRALAELQIVFAERSECDFTELALSARTALRQDDGARDLESASSIHLQHLLVDEMQDTSSSQYDLIQMLTQGWDGHSQTVFLVGDPKQSVYLFRQARVERFLRIMRSEQLGDLPLGVLRLTANFRSQANLVSEFNADFATIFPAITNGQHPEEVPFVAASPIRPSASQSGSRIWHANTLVTDDPNNKKLQRKSDAAEVRRIVEEWQSKPLPPDRPLRDGNPEPWKIAVLVRSRSHLDEIVAEFKGNSISEDDPSERYPGTDRHSECGQQSLLFDWSSNGLPSRKSKAPISYRAVDIEPLETRPEVQDLFALTRALLHPADRTAWLAILHAPWCGFSLADLHTITGADDPAFSQLTIMQLLSDRGDLLDPAAVSRLERIWPILEAAVAATGRLPLAQTVERTWRSLGGDSYLAESELINARRYLQLLDELEAQSNTFDLSALQRKLTKLYASPVIHSGAVDLLTIHKAKGLEWDVVIVPALERKSGSNRPQLLNWVELDSSSQTDEAAHILLAPIQGKGEASAELTTYIRSIRTAREAAERKRLFYVACTRAREELHLFASPVLSAAGAVLPASESLLKSAWPAAEPHFAAAPAETEEEEPLAIAASAREGTELQPTDRRAILQRLPIAFDPTARFRIAKPLHIVRHEEFPAAAPHFERPEGSIAARAFGNAVHAFLELATRQLATGTSSSSVLNAMQSWTPRIAAVLRSEGLQPAMVERLTQRVLHALEVTLKDPHGLWLVSPHEGAAAEYALTAWSTQRSAIRIDRIFNAGPEPLSPGADHLWIVDYKTTTHGAEGLDAFLTAEREKYAPQLEAYAAVLRRTEDQPAIVLALYYPMLSRLIWWKPVAG